MRRVTLIRHAHSVANTMEAPGSIPAEDLAFANHSAGLTERGENECRILAPLLRSRYDITPSTTPVAVSTFERPRLTALRLGFIAPEPYPQLDEVDYGIDLRELRQMLRQNKIPKLAVKAGNAALKDAPEESVWITHGLLIAGICTVLGVAKQYDRPVPRQCEVRQIIF